MNGNIILSLSAHVGGLIQLYQFIHVIYLIFEGINAV